MLSTFHKMLWILVIYLCIGQTKQEPICRPVLSDGKVGKPEIGGYISFECDISTCKKITKVVFEKTDPSGSWVPIFERVNRTYHRALATATGYTLDNRDDYYGFRTQHTLHIMPLILQDHGKWRCAVYDIKQGEHKSGPLDFDIYVAPAEENFFIRPNNSHSVRNQRQEFTCLADGVHPESKIIWEVNGVEYMGNNTGQQRDDQLWIVINTLQMVFGTTGVKKINCAIRTKARDPWLEDHINITVQEPAIVLYPLHALTTTVNVDSALSLKCSGSGYTPHIIWKRNGEIIFVNNTRYIIQEECDTLKCNGSIKSEPIDMTLACVNNEPYSGVYTCVVTLEPPYQSSAESPDIIVTISKTHCKEEHIGRRVGLSMLLVVCVVVVVFLLGFLVHRKRQKTNIAFYKRMTLYQSLELKYRTDANLNLCAQRRIDDQLVLFENGTKRVFIHSINDLTHHKEYVCSVRVHDMIRLSQESFVATAKGTDYIHFLRLEDLNFRSMFTLPRETESNNILICAETDTSFIKCNISRCIPNDDDHKDEEIGDKDDLATGHERYEINISRVDIKNDRFEQKHITDVTMNNEPVYISVTPDRSRVLMATLNGKLYLVTLETPNLDLVELNCKKETNKIVRSMFINNHDIILGDFDGKIIVYTRDLHYWVVQNLEIPVNGITVHDRRMIVCCGHKGKQQSIEVFSPNSVSKSRTPDKRSEYNGEIDMYSSEQFAMTT